MCKKKGRGGMASWGDGLRGIVIPVQNKKRPDYV